MEKPKRKFQPKTVGRRSKEDREQSAPAIKEEPKEPSQQRPAEGPRRRRGIKGEYLDDVQGPLSAPSLADPRNRGRSGPSHSNFGASRGGSHPQLPSKTPQSAKVEDLGDRIDISANNGYYAPQVVSKDSVQGSELPTLELESLYLFSLPPFQTSDEGEQDTGDAMEGVEKTGPIGTLRTHASGKMSMLIDGKVYQVTSGVPTKSVQDVVLTEGKKAYKLGYINERLVVVPDE